MAGFSGRFRCVLSYKAFIFRLYKTYDSVIWWHYGNSGSDLAEYHTFRDRARPTIYGIKSVSISRSNRALSQVEMFATWISPRRLAKRVASLTVLLRKLNNKREPIYFWESCLVSSWFGNRDIFNATPWSKQLQVKSVSRELELLSSFWGFHACLFWRIYAPLITMTPGPHTYIYVINIMV